MSVRNALGLEDLQVLADHVHFQETCYELHLAVYVLYKPYVFVIARSLTKNLENFGKLGEFMGVYENL
jgi:hypothetical protein